MINGTVVFVPSRRMHINSFHCAGMYFPVSLLLTIVTIVFDKATIDWSVILIVEDTDRFFAFLAWRRPL